MTPAPHFQPADPAFAERLTAIAALPIFRDVIGLRVDEISAGTIRAHVDGRPELQHVAGTFQGTATSALAQVLCSFACATLVGATVSTMTLEQSVKFVGPARGERLSGMGQVIRAGTTISFASAEVYAVRNGEERLCAVMTATCHHSAANG